jgi:hypothetical protein
VLDGPGGQAGAGDQLQLAQGVADVRLDRALADHEPLGDVGVAQPSGDQPHHFAFPHSDREDSLVLFTSAARCSRTGR